MCIRSVYVFRNDLQTFSSSSIDPECPTLCPIFNEHRSADFQIRYQALSLLAPFLASFLLGVKCRVPWILYRSLDPFFHCLKTLLWRIKVRSPSLLLFARSQAVFGGIHPVKHRYIRRYVSATTGEPFVVFPCVLYVEES